MRTCENCRHNHCDIRNRWVCDILHVEVFLNDEGCIYHDYERSFTLD